MIEVITEEEAHRLKEQQTAVQLSINEEEHQDDYLQHIALQQRRTINVALVGNPNCGKTSLFNYASGAHGHVGNYSGVTVDASSICQAPTLSPAIHQRSYTSEST